MGFNKPFNFAAIASPSKLNYKNYSIFNVSKNEHLKNNILYHKLKLLKVKDKYHLISSNTINLWQNLEVAKFMNLFRHNNLQNLCNQYFTSTKIVHNYNTRCTIVTTIFIYML